MNRIYKSMIRDIWFSKSRSLVIVISIVLIIAFPMALLDLSANLGAIIQQEESDYKLAHFDIIYSRRTDTRAEERIRNTLTDTLNFSESDFELQSRTYMRMKTQSRGGGAIQNGTWLPIDIIGYNETAKPRINIPYLTEGRFPKKEGEITLLDSYARKDGLTIGDNFTVQNGLDTRTFTIVGLVKSAEFSSYDISQVAAGYVTPNSYEFTIIDIKNRPYTDTLVYFTENPTLEELRLIHTALSDAMKRDSTIPSIALFWFSRETSFRQGLQDSLELTSNYMFVAALFIFAVASIVIYVVTNRSITEQKKVLGAMYAFGNEKSRILKGYLLKTTVLGLIGGTIGMILASYLLDSLVTELGNSWGLIKIQSSISQSSITITVLTSIFISYTSTVLAISNISKLTPYEAMRGKTTELKSKGILFSAINYIPIKSIRISFRDMTRSRTRTLLTVIAFSIALTFAWSLYYTEDSLNYTVNDYYQNRVNFDVDIDIGLENAINKGLRDEIVNQEFVEYWEPFTSILVTFENNPERMTYMNLIQRNSSLISLNQEGILEGRWFEKNSSEIVISQYIAGNYGVKIGQNLTLIALGEKISGSVVGITNDMMYTLSLWMDMDYAAQKINPLNGVLGEQPIINHMLLKITDQMTEKEVIDKLNGNYNVRLVFSKAFYKNRMQTLINTQAAVIFLMSTLGLIVGSVAVFSTFLIAIVERDREIALKRVFGKGRVEVGFQILVEALLLVSIALFPAFFLSKILASELWLGIVANTIFAASSFFPVSTDLKIGIFALLVGIISVFFSVYITTKSKIVDGIREE